MGNSGSASNSENGGDDEVINDSIEDLDKDINENIVNLDLTILFEPIEFQKIADKIKEDGTVSPLQQHHGNLLRWLEERRSRGAETVSLMQFVDALTNKGVSKEVSTEIFQQFDTDEEGILDLDYLQEMLILCARSAEGFLGVRSDIQAVNKLLQECPLAPGFLDAFTTSKTIQINHGQRLFKFLSRTRACGNALSLPALKGFVNTTELRIKFLNNHLSALKEKADSKKREPPLQADEVLKPISRCFTTAEVSSNRNDVSKLTDNDNGTYWQSDGPARSHWVRLHIPPSVVIKQLSMYVVAADQSYMPHHVVVYGGRDESNLRELNDVRIPNHITGDYTLLENLKVPYQVIQISIKRCHSDGCDTRVRQIKAIGYRVVKSKGFSVMDATSMWYLSVLASTAQAAIPIAPNLRQSIIAHTKSSLCHMAPLSLSSSSNEKPSFLSNNVMEQMESFLYAIICDNGKPEPEELVVLIEFAFLRGSLGSALDIIKILLENIKEQYPIIPLLRSLSETEDKAVRKHGTQLPVTILSCDGGVKDSTTSPLNILLEKEVYYTADGTTKCNIAFALKSGNAIQLTKVFMKFMSKGGVDPKAGLVFVFDSDNIKDETGEAIFKPLEKYEDWTENDYKRFKDSQKHQALSKRDPHSPVAFFTVDKDWADIDVSMDIICTGNCVAIKLLAPRQADAERLGISQVNLYGYELSQNELKQYNSLSGILQVVPLNEEDDMDGTAVLLHLLRFLQSMCRDAMVIRSQTHKEAIYDKDTTIDIHDVSLNQLWSIYEMVSASSMAEKESTAIIEILFSLFHTALPFLRPLPQRFRENRKMNLKLKANNGSSKLKDENDNIASTVFHSLCKIVDKNDSSETIHRYAKSIILDGAEVFFPDAQARRNHLLSLVDQVMEDGKAVSLAYTFESLCRFFSNKDASGLLGLPEHISQEDFDPQSVVHVMKTLVSVAYRECFSQIVDVNDKDGPSNLVLLLSAMQKSLVAWCLFQCNSNGNQEMALSMLLQYVDMISSKCQRVFKVLEESEDKVKLVDHMEYSFVSISVRQLILLLNAFTETDLCCITLLRCLEPLSISLADISKHVPDVFTNGMDFEGKRKKDDIVLREWEMESEHDYANNTNFTKVFNCPGCSSFKVEFDPQCETERRYDYLEFTDASGTKQIFHQKVGVSETWPLVVKYEGQKLHFRFHSDGSNTAWGYKFKVSAIGNPDVAFSWIFDLQLNLAKCFGAFCGGALDAKKAIGKEDEERNDEGERALLHSELWSSLFRGGYMVGKLERSLSGFHSSNPSDSSVNLFLCEVASLSSERAEMFLKKCRSQYTGHIIGGKLVDSCANAFFAALVWHTQELRDQISNSFISTNTGEISSGLLYAYTKAQAIRNLLMERRQRILVLKEDHPETSNTSLDPDWPIISCREKSLFLLKFAGLTKVMSKKLSSHVLERRSSIIHRVSRLPSRQDSVESKRPSSVNIEDATSDKFPYFQMISDFVMNESLSHDKIHSLLQYRRKYAKSIAGIYNFAYDFLCIHEGPTNVQVPALLFLQNVLYFQDKFPQHYADYLNGCGLELENRVRKEFYAFVKKLAEMVAKGLFTKPSNNSSLAVCAQSYLLHFLDVDWKAYDYSFITDLRLPDILLNSMQGTIVPLKADDEEAELAMYHRHKKYFQEAKSIGIDAWCEENREKAQLDVQRDINLFIARFSSDLEVVITCDGCSEKIKGSRYRCLYCTDMDLCTSCYASGRRPTEHLESHEVMDLKYTCDNCHAFIVETRLNCTICSNFDLCLGCYKSETYPDCHKSSHQMIRSSLIPGGLFPSRSSNGPALLAYIHHHCWLQFSVLAISLADMLRTTRKTGCDQEYLKSAMKLLILCLQNLVDCIEKPLEMKPITYLSTDFSNIKINIVASELEKRLKSIDLPDRLSRDSNSLLVIDDSVESKIEITASTDETKDIDTIPDLEDVSSNDTKDCVDSVSDTNMSVTSDGMLLNNNDINANLNNTLKTCNDNIEKEANKVDTNYELANSVSIKETVNEVSQLTSLRTNRTLNENISESSENLGNNNIDIANNTTVENESLASFEEWTTNKSEALLIDGTSSEAKLDEKTEETDKEQTTEEQKLDVLKIFDSSNDFINDFNIYFDKSSFELFLREKLLGLVGTIISPDIKASILKSMDNFSSFVTENLIPVIVKIICEEISSNEKMKILSLGILQKTLLCFGPEVGNASLKKILNSTDILTNQNVCVKFLFDHGAKCLTMGLLETACSIEFILNSLLKTCEWQPCIEQHLNIILRDLNVTKQEISSLALYSIMFLAGFPRIYHIGAQATIRETGTEQKDVLVLHGHSLEQTMVSVMNFHTRKKSLIKESSLEPVKYSPGVFNKERFDLLLDILKNNVSLTAGTSSTIESIWLLSLTCKAMLSLIKMGPTKESLLSLVYSGVFPLIVHLSCQGTGFSKHWLLSDLEVLSWKLYKSVNKNNIDEKKEKVIESEVSETKEETKEPVNEEAEKKSLSPLDGLDEKTVLCMETIHDALKCPYPILRAIYEQNGQDKDKLLEEVQMRCFDGIADGCSIRTSDEILEMAKQWEFDEEKKSKENIEPVDITLDVGVLKLQPQSVEFADLQARPESGEIPNKLIASLTEEEINETMVRQSRMQSAELLKKELENEQTNHDREFIKKVNYAVAVNYARQLIGWVFSFWPEDEDILPSMLNNMDALHIVGLLDLIQRSEAKDHFKKVVFNFIRCCSKQFIQPLALSAVQCMGDVRLATETRESEHRYKNNTTLEDKIHIPGATSLFVRFDERCSTEYNCDQLIMSSSANYQQNKKSFSGMNDWQDFEIPGDTLYYKFTSDGTNNDWGWKFTVTGGQLGRFETGCGILSALLAQDIKFARRLPLKQLWSWLVIVACNQVGQQRLMATGLLLRILQISAGDEYLFGEDAEATPQKSRPNLSLLRPLWTMYTNNLQSETRSSNSLISPVMRGLSELFLVVENIAQDWGEADNLVAGFAAEDKMRMCFTKVVRNIAAIGIAIGIPNKAIDMVRNAKDYTQTPTTNPRNASSSRHRGRHGFSRIIRITNDSGSDSDIDVYEDDYLDDRNDSSSDNTSDASSDASSDSSDLSEPENLPM